ncbi:MAG: branched-chain amino acid ABC transporter permease, partial [Lachnospiraceae bacterium]|nr:branched-chain amino acid ABC transporter permease [Lachnospiraceae bacterium]
MEKVKKMKKKNLQSNLITYALVILAFAIMQAWQSSGNLSSLLSGLLVPICVYVILALSLNLVVGISGELSLGHAGFMCVGAFASAFFSKCTAESISFVPLRFFLAILI